MAEATTSGATRAGWAMLGLLVALNVVNFVDRQLLASFAVDVMRELKLSYFQFGLLSGTTFTIVYTFAGIVAGRLADRLPRIRLIALGAFAWSAFTALSGLARGFLELALFRGGVAIGESVLSPSAISILGDTFPPQRRGLAISIYYLGIPVGAGGSLILAGILGPIIGWRGCFILMGLIGVVGAAAMLFLREPPRRAPTVAAKGEKSSILGLLSNPTLMLIYAGAFFLFLPQGALVLDQPWLAKERGYEVHVAQTTFGAIFLLGGLVGTLLAGWSSDLAFKKAPKGGRLYFLCLCFAVFIPAAFAFRLVEPGTPVFYLLALVGSASLLFPYGPILASIEQAAPKAATATAAAIGITAMALGSTAVGSAAGGAFADMFAGMGVEQPLTATFLLMNALACIGPVLLFLAARRLTNSSNAGEGGQPAG